METRRSDKRPAEPEAERRDAAPALEPAPLRGRPANENDPGTSMMLARLRRRPSYAPYYVAFALSLAWIAGWFFALFGHAVCQSRADSAARHHARRRPAGLPIGIIWVTAYFLWRAPQLRQVSEVLMQSAMRLIRPQDIATEGLTTIAQAVRSEVDLLVGGVEHAVQRAAVLEEIVHKEISAIERAFGGNEERIRSLVTGLENQRAALHQASSCSAMKAPLLTRLETNTQNLDSVVNTPNRRLSGLNRASRIPPPNLPAPSMRLPPAPPSPARNRRPDLADGAHVRHADQRIAQLLAAPAEPDTNPVSAAGHLNAETTNFGRNVQGMESNVTNLLVQSIDQIKELTAEMSDVVQSSSGNITYHLKATTSEVGLAH